MENHAYAKSSNIFSRSANELKSTRTLATCAMLLAVELLLSYIGSFAIGLSLRVSFYFLPVATAAYLFGPVPAMLINAISDVLMVFLKPMGAYFPGFTVTAALSGLVYGLIFYGKSITTKRIVAAKLIVDIFLNIGLNTYWLQMIQGKAFMLLLPARAIKNMLQLPVDVMLLMLLFSSLGRVFKALGRPMPESVPVTSGGKKKLITALIVVFWMVVAVWLNNTSLIGATYSSEQKLAVNAAEIYQDGYKIDSVTDIFDEAAELGAQMVAIDIASEPSGGAIAISELGALLDAYPDQILLLNLTDDNAEALWRVLKTLDPVRLQSLIIRGDEQQMQYLSSLSDELRVVVPSMIDAGMRDYLLLGWLGYVPDSLMRTLVVIDYQSAYFKWGFPSKFVQRMAQAGTEVLLIESVDYPEFDGEMNLRRVPENYNGFILMKAYPSSI